MGVGAAEVQTGSESARPLVVDVDGTLIRTDLLVESFLALAAKNPLTAIAALAKLAQGKAALKAHLADLIVVETHLLPLDPEVVALIEAARAEGRPVFLASASDRRYVEALAAHTGWFNGVFATEAGTNLGGKAKADVLVAQFGEKGFDYVGNADVDFEVWRHCETPYLAGGASGVKRKLIRLHPNAVILDAPRGGVKPFLRALRPHQWLKNLLVFIPAAAGHDLLPNIPALLIAFLTFSFCASSVYITNDLLDLAGDREHPRKRKRPFASGAASAQHGIALAVVLLLAAACLSALLPIKFIAALAGYYLLTTAYSLYLKRKPVVDVIALACLYGVRVVAGGYASDTVLSPWLGAFAIFLFLSLALVKRCAELVDRINSNKGDPKGRGYVLGDYPALQAMAAAAGYNAAVVLALYIGLGPEQALYAHPRRLWVLVVLLLAWLSRIYVLTARGRMNDDPVVFAVKDRWSLVLGACCALVVLAAGV